MKLVNLYLIGVFIMIAFLVGSTMWQYNQFKANVQNLQFGLPQELAQGMPDANQQIGDIMAQIQNQMQNQTQPDAAKENAVPAETKTWTAPDNAFSFEYAADWTPMDLGGQAVESDSGKILFSAYKIAAQSSIPSTNSLTVEESTAQTAEEAMEKIESDLRAKNIPAKITRGEIIKGNQTIPVMEIDYSTSEAILNTGISFKIINAFITDKNQKIYIMSIILQNPNPTITQETNKMIESISITNKN